MRCYSILPWLRPVLALMPMMALLGEEAAALPMGWIEGILGDVVEVRFVGDHPVQPAGMLAIYGPGSVEKHPLTHAVIVERPQRIARAQALRVDKDMITARVLWRAEGAVIAVGQDVVPTPGPARVNAPPIVHGDMPAITVPAQGQAVLSLPVVDPDGDPMAVRWATDAEVHSPGLLMARLTGLPINTWLAPATPGVYNVQLSAQDTNHQRLDLRVPIEVTERAEDWRARRLVPWLRFGSNADAVLQWIGPVADGRWWGITDRGEVHEIAAGWHSRRSLTFASNVSIRAPVTIVPRNDELLVLDERERAILVVALDGVLRQRIDGLRSPSDLVQASDGSIFVADQGAGGVLVFEPDGSFRATLGRSGEGRDAFSALSRLAIDRDDTVYALDARQQQILRFDRHHRRLATWPIQLGDRITALDIHASSHGLLVLLDNGRLLIIDAHGIAGRTLPSVVEAGWSSDMRVPARVATDLSGHIYVTYPNDGAVARYAADGRLLGVRGPGMWAHDAMVVDGRGASYGIDYRSAMLTVADAEGWVTNHFGGQRRDDGPFERPQAIALGGRGRYLAVLDTRRTCVVRFDLERGDRPLICGQSGSNDGQFDSPVDVAVDDRGHIYVLDQGLRRVAVFDANGAFLFNVGRYDRGREQDEMIRPEKIAVDPQGTMLFVYDSRRYEVMKFDLDHQQSQGVWRANTGGRGHEAGQFRGLTHLACDRLGLLYALDGSRRDLQVIDFRGGNGIPLLTVPLADFGLRSAGLALHDDGYPWLFGDGMVIGLRWE